MLHRLLGICEIKFWYGTSETEIFVAELSNL